MRMTRSLLAAAAAMALIAPASAADLGGNCCADLEERVAELEATAAKKGNRKVSLTLSGYVSHSIMAWDDGKVSDTYIGDGGAISSRFRLQGSSKINQNLTAGFLYEFGAHDNALGKMTQNDKGNAGLDDLGGDIILRDSTVWLRHNGLGMVKIGYGSTATDNLILIDVSGAGAILTPDVGLFNGSFATRIGSASIGSTSFTTGVVDTLAPLTWGQLFNGGVSFDTARRNHVLYETPSLAGFTVQGAIAENNFWDIALRYAGEVAGFRLAGGVGYSVDTEAPTFGYFGSTAKEVKEMKGSASVLHVASGLFATGSAGQREVDWKAAGISIPFVGTGNATAKDAMFWHLSGGWSKNVFGPGNTVLYGEYQSATDMVGYTLMSGGPTPTQIASVGSEATMWGIGAVQHIDAAAMEVFLSYRNFSADVDATINGTPKNTPAHLGLKDFSTLIGGVRIQF